MARPEPNVPADPVFVGGTGRSGTTILGQLIGEHSHYAFVPMEIKFHCDPRGLAGLLRGDTSLDECMTYMRGEWFSKKASAWSDPDYARRWERLRKTEYPDPEIRFDMDPERILELLDDFESGYPNNPGGAARGLIRSLLDPIASRKGKLGWVETTPSNGKYADILSEIFPEMKIVHIVRDGRDVASSRLARNRRPLSENGQAEFWRELRWWAKRLQLTVRAMDKLRPDQTLTLSFEGMIATDRDRCYGELLDFLGLGDEDPVRDFFDTRMPPDAANIGRWQSDPLISPDQATAMYQRVLGDLHEEGVTVVPRAEAVDEPPARAGSGSLPR